MEKAGGVEAFYIYITPISAIFYTEIKSLMFARGEYYVL